MMDRLTSEHRSWNMSRIRGSDTAPELLVRSALHRLGFRFRLNRKDLPGKPDIVLPKHKIAILVHGCYWHRHSGCKNCYTPKSNISFWMNKFEKNVARDAEVKTLLEQAGWKPVTIWECEAKRSEELPALLSRLLETAIRKKSHAQGRRALS
jgi:DNA mismatch endonuclease, patch repair protein